MTDLIDKIAIALYFQGRETSFVEWEKQDESLRDEWRKVARTALAAIEASGTHVVAPAEGGKE